MGDYVTYREGKGFSLPCLIGRGYASLWGIGGREVLGVLLSKFSFLRGSSFESNILSYYANP